MKAEPYDVAHLASQAVHFVLASGASVDDALRALALAERMLRNAYDAERNAAAEPGHDPVAIH